eukprot:10163482-Karenia_brevis.AAC.1
MAIMLKDTNISKEEVQDFFAPTCHHLCIGYDMSENLASKSCGTHVLAYLQLKERKRVLDIYRSLRDKFQGRYGGLPEAWKLQQCSFINKAEEKHNMDAIHWIRCCKKDPEYIEFGEPHDDHGKSE